jgi:hypothetical protein
MNHHTTPSNEVHASSSTSPYPSSSSNKNPSVHDDDDINTSSFEDLSMNAALGIDASESPPERRSADFVVLRIPFHSRDDRFNRNLYHGSYPIYTPLPNERERPSLHR